MLSLEGLTLSLEEEEEKEEAGKHFRSRLVVLGPGWGQSKGRGDE